MSTQAGWPEPEDLEEATRRIRQILEERLEALNECMKHAADARLFVAEVRLNYEPPRPR